MAGPLLSLIDHVAITVADVEATTAFYARLFSAEIIRSHVIDGRLIVRAIRIGGGVQLSVHQLGNGVDLVAARPTPGSVDICFRFSGRIEQAVALLAAQGVEIIDGPSPRQNSDMQSAQSVYFRDPDGNL